MATSAGSMASAKSVTKRAKSSYSELVERVLDEDFDRVIAYSRVELREEEDLRPYDPHIAGDRIRTKDGREMRVQAVSIDGQEVFLDDGRKHFRHDLVLLDHG